MTRVNGQPAESVSVLDRGLAYGDGVFRTLHTQDGQPLWWADHYAKLVSDCRVLGMACPDEALLRDEVTQEAVPGEGVVKIVLTRGTGARGYALPAQPSVTRVVMGSALPDHARPEASPDIRARWCALRLGTQPRLAGVKHLNRLENVMARAEWDDPDILEGLLRDESGAVVGGVMSNVFWARGEVLFTPDLTGCGVAGVARSRLLRAAARLGIEVRIGRWQPDAILAADEVMICNSVIGVRRVARLDDATWTPAGWTATLNTALNDETD